MGAERAYAMGLPFNRLVTIHWEAMGLDDAGAAHATQALICKAKDWLRDRGVRFASAWVRENDAGDGSKGSHLHWLVHVPDNHRAAFLRAVARFACDVAGIPARVAGGVHSRPVGAVGLEGRNLDAYRLNLAHALAYLSKQSDQFARASIGAYARRVYPAFDVARLPELHAGRVTGKRAGISRLLARA